MPNEEHNDDDGEKLEPGGCGAGCWALVALAMLLFVRVSFSALGLH